MTDSETFTLSRFVGTGMITDTIILISVVATVSGCIRFVFVGFPVSRMVATVCFVVR